MGWWLFIDDERDPAITVEDFSWRRRMALVPIDYSQPRQPWTIARSHDEAVRLVAEFGFPEHVSFDHDLGDAASSGLTFARFLVDLDLSTGAMPEGFAFDVHSANPVGKANIVGLMESYLSHRSRAPKP